MVVGLWYSGGWVISLFQLFGFIFLEDFFGFGEFWLVFEIVFDDFIMNLVEYWWIWPWS